MENGKREMERGKGISVIIETGVTKESIIDKT